MGFGVGQGVLERGIASETTSEFIMVGVSSIHVTKSFTFWAYRARP